MDMYGNANLKTVPRTNMFLFERINFLTGRESLYRNGYNAFFYLSTKMSVTEVMPLLNISRVTVIDCINFFQDIFTTYFECNPIRQGGPRKIMQIDESCFSQKTKLLLK